MSLVKEETELGLGLVAHFRQPLEQLGEQPQEKSRIEARIAHQFIRGQNVDVSSPILIGPNEILERDRGLAEELVAALILQDEELALDGADGGLGDVAEPLRCLPDRRECIVCTLPWSQKRKSQL